MKFTKIDNISQILRFVGKIPFKILIEKWWGNGGKGNKEIMEKKRYSREVVQRRRREVVRRRRREVLEYCYSVKDENGRRFKRGSRASLVKLWEVTINGGGDIFMPKTCIFHTSGLKLVFPF